MKLLNLLPKRIRLHFLKKDTLTIPEGYQEWLMVKDLTNKELPMGSVLRIPSEIYGKADDFYDKLKAGEFDVTVKRKE